MKENIGFVGVGRMGANMARRLKDCGYRIAAVYDVNRPAAAALARELGARHARSLAQVTAAADVVFTVVTDDAAQLEVFAEEGDSLLVRREREDLRQLRHDHPEDARRDRAPGEETRRRDTRGMHGLLDSAGAPGDALPHVRRRKGGASRA